MSVVIIVSNGAAHWVRKRPINWPGRWARCRTARDDYHVHRTIQINEFSTEHESQVRRLVLGTLGEFGFSFDLALDSDLGRIKDVYSGRGRFWVAIGGDERN
jgi:hypothetical protein